MHIAQVFLSPELRLYNVSDQELPQTIKLYARLEEILEKLTDKMRGNEVLLEKINKARCSLAKEKGVPENPLTMEKYNALLHAFTIVIKYQLPDNIYYDGWKNALIADYTFCNALNKEEIAFAIATGLSRALLQISSDIEKNFFNKMKEMENDSFPVDEAIQEVRRLFTSDDLSMISYRSVVETFYIDDMSFVIFKCLYNKEPVIDLFVNSLKSIKRKTKQWNYFAWRKAVYSSLGVIFYAHRLVRAVMMAQKEGIFVTNRYLKYLCDQWKNFSLMMMDLFPLQKYLLLSYSEAVKVNDILVRGIKTKSVEVINVSNIAVEWIVTDNVQKTIKENEALGNVIIKDDKLLFRVLVSNYPPEDWGKNRVLLGKKEYGYHSLKRIWGMMQSDWLVVYGEKMDPSTAAKILRERLCLMETRGFCELLGNQMKAFISTAVRSEYKKIKIYKAVFNPIEVHIKYSDQDQAPIVKQGAVTITLPIDKAREARSSVVDKIRAYAEIYKHVSELATSINLFSLSKEKIKEAIAKIVYSLDKDTITEAENNFISVLKQELVDPSVDEIENTFNQCVEERKLVDEKIAEKKWGFDVSIYSRQLLGEILRAKKNAVGMEQEAFFNKSGISEQGIIKAYNAIMSVQHPNNAAVKGFIKLIETVYRKPIEIKIDKQQEDASAFAGFLKAV
jgi:hypothetical protein